MDKFIDKLNERALKFSGEESAMIYADAKTGQPSAAVIAGDARAIIYCIYALMKRFCHKCGVNLLDVFEAVAEIDAHCGDRMEDVVINGKMSTFEDAREAAEKAEREKAENEAALRRRLEETIEGLNEAKAIIKGLKDDIQAEREKAWKLSTACDKKVLDMEHRMEEMASRATWEEANNCDD